MFTTNFTKSFTALISTSIILTFLSCSNSTVSSNNIATKNTEESMKNTTQTIMPDEGDTHKRTWISFVASHDIWAPIQVPEVKRNLATLAKTIAKYEPVSILVSKYDKKELIELLGGVDTHNFTIELVEIEMNDLWVRDTGSIFVYDENNTKAGINFNFNGWGEKQEYALDSNVANLMNQKAGVKTIYTDLVLEGGSIEVDGKGTAILTESSVINENRNPDMSKKEIEVELSKLLGIKKFIWLKGIKGEDITDGHIDFYARFVREGVVVASYDSDSTSYDYDVTKANIEMLKNSVDVNGNVLEVIVLKNPQIINESFGIEDFAPGYIGYYLCNGALIMQKFGDKKADEAAYQSLQKAFPNRVIEQISIDGIASGGGTIHCSTQQEPLD